MMKFHEYEWSDKKQVSEINEYMSIGSFIYMNIWEQLCVYYGSAARWEDIDLMRIHEYKWRDKKQNSETDKYMRIGYYIYMRVCDMSERYGAQYSATTRWEDIGMMIFHMIQWSEQKQISEINEYMNDR